MTNFKKVVPNPHPFVTENVVETIRLQLQRECSEWLERAFPIGYLTEDKINGKTHKFPRCYINDGGNDYVDLMPTYKLRSYSFFEIEEYTDIDFNEQEIKYDLSIIFFANLDAIVKRNYDYTSELIADSIRALTETHINCGISDVKIVENFEDIYDKYNFDEKMIQQFMFPSTSWKLTFEITDNFNTSCLPKFNLDNC